ncbi:hypothetical protein MTR67_032308 [Solanum verrucosum]|uniref:Piwi domain-containing protein n=1 Tax=Solanum verrucosum TaxID=315347 RepID=A0AAF0U462_SOLVR|nr:hypothetical protein MTR67_032308 [Solanum verrucosum]
MLKERRKDDTGNLSNQRKKLLKQMAVIDANREDRILTDTMKEKYTIVEAHTRCMIQGWVRFSLLSCVFRGTRHCFRAGQTDLTLFFVRDGVSESQFSQLLNLELDQMVKAYNHLGEGGNPKFTLIVAQKNHHTKLFQANAVDNVPPGTVVDTNIVHPRNNDFFMCAHAGMIGTTKPAHYHVLLDEIGFAPDVLQNLIHSLSYVYQRSTSATSIVAPVRYAHLAAQQFGQFDKFEDHSETSSEQGSVKSIGTTPVTELPRLHKNVSDSMFFC